MSLAKEAAQKTANGFGEYWATTPPAGVHRFPLRLPAKKIRGALGGPRQIKILDPERTPKDTVERILGGYIRRNTGTN